MKFTNTLLSSCAVGAFLMVLTSTATSDATVTEVSGAAYTVHSTPVKPITQHQKLKPGDQFSTGENGRVTLIINEKCTVKIPPLHFVKIKDLKTCPAALPLNGAAAGEGASKAAVTYTVGGSSAVPVVLFGAAVAAAIIHDNNETSPQ